MWTLQNDQHDSTDKFYLLVDNEFTVGRKNASLLILNEPSISRIHAKIHVEHDLSNIRNPSQYPKVTLTDNSKYGIYLNGSKEKITSSVQLQDGDTIRFGFQQQQWRISYQPFVVATSRLNVAAEKNSVISSVRKLGGHFVNNWTEGCTHLVVNEIRVTVKVLSALTSCKPIVTPKYIIDLVNSIESKKESINPDNYLPPLSEIEGDVTSRDQFKVDIQRQNMFCNKIFVFLLNKQYQRLKQALISCGAKVRLVESRETIDQTLLLSYDSIVITPNLHDMKTITPSQKNLVETVEGLLLSNGFRLISDTEIGLAIIHINAPKYCNPSDPSVVSDGKFGVSAPQAKQLADPATSLSQSKSSEIKASDQDTKQKRLLQITDSEQYEPQKKVMKLEYDTHKTDVKNIVKMKKQVTLPKGGKEPSEPPEKKLKLIISNGSGEGFEQDHATNNSNQSDTAAEIFIDTIPAGYLSAKLYSNQVETEDCEKEFNGPKEQVIDLIIRRKETKTHVESTCNNKNFKKFRKSYYPGRDRVGLPTIIGGNDLLRHTAGGDSGLGDWILEARRAHDEKAREDQLADELFRLDPSKKRGVGR